VINLANLVENDLWIIGSKQKREAVLDFIGNKDAKDDAEKLFDFNKVSPYPQKFRDLDLKYPLSSKDGYNNGGYEWCIKNWGTGKNVFNVWVNKQTKSIFLTFDTAWHPPIPIIFTLSKKFPEVEFKIKFYEASLGFKGHYIFHKGIVMSEGYTENYRGGRGG
jgi:hypothetical protein